MPNRGELTYSAARQNDASTDDGAWAFVQLCAIGWSVSIYVAVLSEPIDYIPALMAQLPFG
jgi:hypothetical protein